MVERIILRRGGLLRIGVIEGNAHLGLLREELTQLDVGRHAILGKIVHASLRQRLIQGTEACGLDMTTQVDRTQIREGHIQVGLGCPSPSLIKVSHTQLIHPYLTALDGIAVIAHTDHDHLHLRQTRVTDDTDAVAGIVRVILGIDSGVADVALPLSFQLVTLQFQVGQGL